MAYLGEEIPKLGFGLMRLPKLEGENAGTDIEQVKQMVDAFIAAGGTYFDTAWAYGSSESDIKAALVDRYPRESYQLATKIASWRVETAEEAHAQFETSLERTGAGYFDFYLVHNTGDNRTEKFDRFKTWDFVKKLKAEGKVKHIGFSHHDSAATLEELLIAHPEMEFVQLQINYADWEDGSTQSRQCMEVCAKYGKPVVIMEPVRGGTLANPPEPVADILRAANPEVSPVDWALRFCFDLPSIITVLSGMSTLEQMQQNLKTWKSHTPLSEDEREVLRNAQAKLKEITRVPCTACKYCMKVCPQDVQIANIMKCLNLEAIYGIEAGKRWYNFGATMMKGQASKCIQCEACNDSCPQHIDVVNELQAAVELFE